MAPELAMEALLGENVKRDLVGARKNPPDLTRGARRLSKT
jgi:hypothetical protein